MIEGICINSALLSAQNRVRYYWTNIPNVTQPTDQGILLKDILEIDAEEPMYSNIYGGFGEKKPRTHFSKSVTIRANSGGGAIPSISKKPVHNKINQAKVDNMQPGDIAATQMNNSKNFGNAVNVDGKAFTLRASNPNGVLAKEKNNKAENELHYRKLTPLECMRLQTVPDDYKMPVSNTQKYKLLGNGFTVAVIQHIFSHMEAT
jgi:site-specific DNA-cytosine methylase